eukprot:m.1233338 g.1233338  ORF g.1233338 m.1233338 type:complete len:317 (+) comp24662_c0_seq15:341-1291(+)
MHMINHSQIANNDVVQRVWSNMRENYYLSIDWSPKFYTDLAYQAFIAVAQEQSKGLPILIPEIQKEYCMLEFENLHIGRTVKKRCKQRAYRFCVNKDMKGVLAGIDAHHESNWVIRPYKELLLLLQSSGPAAVEASDKKTFFHAISIELYDAASDKLVAGEVGYVIGKTYTSLTGFFDTSTAGPEDSKHATPPKEPEGGKDGATSDTKNAKGDKCDSPDASATKLKFSSAGKIQLVALGLYLKQCGVELWNLGHPPRPATKYSTPQMMYKAEIGGSVLPRKEFLAKWCAARQENLPTKTLPSVDIPVLDLLKQAAV